MKNIKISPIWQIKFFCSTLFALIHIMFPNQYLLKAIKKIKVEYSHEFHQRYGLCLLKIRNQDVKRILSIRMFKCPKERQSKFITRKYAYFVDRYNELHYAYTEISCRDKSFVSFFQFFVCIFF